MLYEKDRCLCFRNGKEVLEIRPWGRNSFRVRATKYPKFNGNKNALTEEIEENQTKITIEDGYGQITNGLLTAKIDEFSNLCFYNEKGEVLLKGYQRNRVDTMNTGVDASKISHFNSALNIDSREFKSNIGGDYEIRMRFETRNDEKIFGMGQYQQDFLDLKNAKLELAHRNSQASVPFMLSNIGYGFLWNTPAIGDVSFAKNITEWHAISAKEVDFWITAGDNPAQIEEQYSDATGKVPMMPDYGLGYWQCKLRYRTQEEVLNAAHEFKKRELPIDVIVIDYFHWTKSGEYKFDKTYWPDVEKMTKELHEMGIKVMVSVWPTVDETSSHYKEMNEHGYLVEVERGVPITMNFLGNNGFVDFTNPEARQYVWRLLKKNYLDKGVDLFWLDEAEPEYSVYDFDNYRYYEGSNLQVGNIYPVKYSQMVYEGMKKFGKSDDIVNLVRSAWAGSQKYGALVWSGDIDSSFQSLRNQVAIGLNMGIAGIPWWTTDIGGFHGGVNDDPNFQELVTRWFQFATFCPVMRMHGDREPHTSPLSNVGGGKMPSGGPTEPWSYGDDALGIMTKYMNLRVNLKSYIKKTMASAHEKGTPIIRPIFYDFYKDKKAWDIEDQYMFGDDILVIPILFSSKDRIKRQIYFPKGTNWIDSKTGSLLKGGTTLIVNTEIETIPTYIRENKFNELKEAFEAIQ
ncbi:glycoside hydrolase family 31 protein [Leuconostoc gelidum]|uniref:glycoside hydrolase family 31 protein n=1 Tax=Leuconostoc gelidum TaxID=1244 RepID=UPI001C7E1ADC|nr:TIM-barrel domain-containing protein [Leuconostoc gelidum]MBZ6009893.1 family 31 glucosidase [Leuconostoc gelidum subsp. aenigmaticum]